MECINIILCVCVRARTLGLQTYAPGPLYGVLGIKSSTLAYYANSLPTEPHPQPLRETTEFKNSYTKHSTPQQVFFEETRKRSPELSAI